MDRHTVGVALVAILLVFAGCASDAGSQTQIGVNSGSDGGDNQTTTTPPSPYSEDSSATETRSESSSSTSDGTFEVHSINVDQGDSTLIISPTNQTMLIDTGDYSDNGEIVLEYLKNHNITRIDYLVSTHADADHIGGNAEIIEYYESQAEGIGAVYDPGIASSSGTYQDYLDAVEKHNVTLYETHAGDNIPLKGVQTQVLSPPEQYIDNRDRNENSIVLRFTFGQTSFVLPGDIEETGESRLASEYGSHLNSTILKAAHHGSAGSSTEPFLNAVSPTVTLISSAYDSQYGHPAPETLQRLADQNIEAYWTATHGNIVLTSDGSTIDIATQQKAPTEPTAVRDGNPIEPGSDKPVTHRATIQVGSSTTETVSETATDSTRDTPTSTDPSTSTITSDGGTDTGSALAVRTVHADAEGDESENLNDEYIVFENTGSTSLNISGWTIEDRSSHSYTVPSGTTIDAGETLTLHTGEGRDTDSDLYWGSGRAIWNNGGDTIMVTNDEGQEMLSEDYS
ncbi:lamin tail domain-containing protein [Halococcus salsus]|uniref:lamin tail domain-containing protein n=1 Tax=Halococcus salsus TaxID=2162894 RepID=UPI00135B0485|nr:lamin tail domain-containing protein [Halococcus salsus]